MKWMYKVGNICDTLIDVIVSKLLVVATVYYVWQERNLRLFKQESMTKEIVFKIIIENVKWHLLSLKVKRSNAVLQVARK